MAQRMKWLGVFVDPNYGIDNDGELFASKAAAKRELSIRHREGYSRRSLVQRTNGTSEELLFPNVTNEANILLYELIDEDQLPLDGIAERHAIGSEILTLRASDYTEMQPDAVIWVGARQSVREGTFAEFVEQAERRAHGEVLAAGSVMFG